MLKHCSFAKHGFVKVHDALVCADYTIIVIKDDVRVATYANATGDTIDAVYKLACAMDTKTKSSWDSNEFHLRAELIATRTKSANVESGFALALALEQALCACDAPANDSLSYVCVCILQALASHNMTKLGTNDAVARRCVARVGAAFGLNSREHISSRLLQIICLELTDARLDCAKRVFDDAVIAFGTDDRLTRKIEVSLASEMCQNGYDNKAIVMFNHLVRVHRQRFAATPTFVAAEELEYVFSVYRTVVPNDHPRHNDYLKSQYALLVSKQLVQVGDAQKMLRDCFDSKMLAAVALSFVNMLSDRHLYRQLLGVWCAEVVAISSCITKEQHTTMSIAFAQMSELLKTGKLVECAECEYTSEPEKLQRCSGCSPATLYCSRRCQQRAWKSGHREHCKLHPR